MSDNLQSVVDKAKEIYELYNNVIFGGQDDVFYYDGKEVPSIKNMMKEAINNAILSGDIEVPKGKIITDIYVDENGELIVDTKDL